MTPDPTPPYRVPDFCPDCREKFLAVVGCGTRTIIDAVFGPASVGETTYATKLLSCLHEGMLVLADRNFAAGALLAAVDATGAHLLVRARTGRSGPTLPVLHRLRDGSYLSRWDGLPVRVIDAEITIATHAGRRTGAYRLVTSLLDPHRYPALEILRLYHQRWEIETCYLELKSSILGGRVLRAGLPLR
jgi:hypothetical protein